MISPETIARIEALMAEASVFEDDLEESFILGGGPGGQKTNKTSSVVRLAHAPSGMAVRCGETRSRETNRWLARRMLAEAILAREKGRATAEQQRREKVRRQKRRRSRRQKQKMLGAGRLTRMSSAIALHVCCGPCASACVPRLVADGREVTMVFANSNIDTAEEFERRRAAAAALAEHDGVAFEVVPYDHAEWLREVAAGFEGEPEHGARCERCFRYSLRKVAEFAAAHGIGDSSAPWRAPRSSTSTASPTAAASSRTANRTAISAHIPQLPPPLVFLRGKEYNMRQQNNIVLMT